MKHLRQLITYKPYSIIAIDGIYKVYKGSRYGMWNVQGILAKSFARALMPPDNLISNSCLQHVKSSVCNLLTADSGPDALQALFASAGVYSAISSLAPNLDSKNQAILTGGVMAGLILLGEVVTSAIYNVPLNYSDITTEALGSLPIVLLTYKTNQNNGETQ